jgi:hypothetical protein
MDRMHVIALNDYGHVSGGTTKVAIGSLNGLAELGLAVAFVSSELEILPSWNAFPVCGARDGHWPLSRQNRCSRGILPFRTPMVHHTVMMRKSTLSAVGGYMYAHSREDWQLLLRIARNRDWKFHNLDCVLFEYRRHAAQGTRPDLMRAVFLETAAFLFSEFLRTGSVKYLVRICLKFPPALKTHGMRFAGSRETK